MIATPATAIGRLIQKIRRQSTSTSSPPIAGPTASAIEDTAVQIPIACAWRSPGNASQVIASESEISAAPPTPWTTRPTMIAVSLCAVAETTEPIAKIVIPARKTRFRPSCRRGDPR